MIRERQIKKPDLIFTSNYKTKRKGTQGRYSKYYKIWNEYHPDDPIIPNTGYVIHHIDENPNNNNPDNLQKMTDREHKKHHTNNGKHPNQGKKFSDELRKKLSMSHLGHTPSNKGKPMSEETKAKLRESLKGRKSSYGMLGKKWGEETREKMKKRRSGIKGKHHSEETKLKLR
jgi:hypothetical protein